MSVEQQVDRVVAGAKNTLKLLIQKLGGTVPDNASIDTYEDIAAGLSGTLIYKEDLPASGLLKVSGVDVVAAVAGTDYLSPNGGNLTGPFVAQTNAAYAAAQMRNVIISTADPASSDGENGDIWLKYKEDE